jgi:cystathionine beta-lyase/cystathionine gamma-synthase
MAAIALTFLAHLRAGDHVVVFGDSYCETRTWLTEELPRFGAQTTLIAASAPQNLLAAVGPQTRIVYAETIANPSLRLADVAALAAMTRPRGILLCVDNTFATPVLCRPLDHGADLVLHSATKFLGGHHDMVAGIVAGRRELVDSIRRHGRLYGMTLGAMDAWLALRGLHTVAPRIAWMSESAAAIAAFLHGHPAVAGVQYPGLPGHPDAALALRLLPHGAGAILTFSLRGGPRAASRLIRRLQLIPYALSLGGTTTTVCYPPQTEAPETAGCHGPLSGSATIRMSVGLEDADDLIADLGQALAALPSL